MNGHCPVCVEAELSRKIRDGVEIDVCLSCRGIWLDRGELEKLIARANQELSNYPSRDSEPPSSGRGHSKQHPQRRRSFLESLGNIFD